MLWSNARMPPLAPVVLATVVCGALLPAAATAAPRAAVSGATGSTVIAPSASAPATRGLKAAHVRVTAVAPAKIAAGRWTLPAASTTTVKATSVSHRGAIRLSLGRRSVVLGSPRLRLGAKPAVDALVGARNVTVFSVIPAKRAPLSRNPTAGTLRLTGATISLTPAGAAAIRKALKLRTLRSGRLGTLTLTVARPPATTSSPPSSTTPPPSGGTPPPGPGPATVDRCRVTSTPLTDTRPAPASIGTTTWSGTGLAGGTQFGFDNLRSWLNYIRTCWDPRGTVEPIDGATHPAGADDYTYGYAITADVVAAATRTVTHQGTIAYRLSVHGIDTRITDPVITYDAAAGTGTVTASGQYSGDRAAPDAPPTSYSNKVVFTLTRAAGQPTGVSNAVVLDALLAPDGVTIFGSSYTLGSQWGTFTLPAAP